MPMADYQREQSALGPGLVHLTTHSLQTSTSMPLQLYEHEPSSLLPLLERYLPHTQAVLGAIVSSPAPGCEPRSVLDAPPLETVFASFPPGSLPNDEDEDWLVALALPAPSEQVRIWHRAEVRLNGAEGARVRALSGSVVSPAALRDGTHEASKTGGKDLNSAAEAVVEARRTMRQRFPRHFVLGQLNAAFEPAVRTALGAPGRGICRVFLAPQSLPDPGDVDLEQLGLKLDTTRVGDEAEVSPPKGRGKGRADGRCPG